MSFGAKSRWKAKTDQELQVLYHSNTNAVLKAFSERYGSCVMATAAAILKDVRDAEEIMWDTFMALDRTLREKSLDDIAAWLKRVARNKSISLLRKNKTWKQLLLDWTLEEEIAGYALLQIVAEDAPSDEDVENFKQRFFEALEQYEEEIQIVLIGRLFHQQSYKELAEEVGWAAESARSRAATVKRAIIKQLRLNDKGMAKKHG